MSIFAPKKTCAQKNLRPKQSLVTALPRPDETLNLGLCSLISKRRMYVCVYVWKINFIRQASVSRNMLSNSKNDKNINKPIIRKTIICLEFDIIFKTNNQVNRGKKITRRASRLFWSVQLFLTKVVSAFKTAQVLQ